MSDFLFTATADDVDKRIDKFVVSKDLELTRSAIQKLIEQSKILVNDKSVSKNYKLKLGDLITITIPVTVELEALPQNIPVEIIYEDNDLLVVNKPKGMVVHPAPGNMDSTLANALMYHCKGKLSSINGVIRPGIVHRIDKNTSGLLIVAKNDKSHNSLAKQIKEHSFTREYYAINCGHFTCESGTIDAPIGRDKYNRKKMCVTQLNSKNAVTHYSVLENFNHCTLTKFILETGRTHQIRVHSSYVGNPVLGDNVYGKSFSGLEGQCLHAKKIGFIHPTTMEYMEFDSQLPEYFEKILNKLTRQNR